MGLYNLSDKCSLHHDVYTGCPESDYHDIVLALWKTPGVSVRNESVLFRVIRQHMVAITDVSGQPTDFIDR